VDELRQGEGGTVTRIRLTRLGIRWHLIWKREAMDPFWIYVIAAAVILLAIHLGRSAS